MFMCLFFRFVVDIYVGFASASSNLAAPSYNSPRSTQECTDLLRTHENKTGKGSATGDTLCL
jgi:hypothetical protein